MFSWFQLSRRVPALFGLALMLGAILIACGGGDDDVAPTATTAPAVQAAATATTAPVVEDVVQTLDPEDIPRNRTLIVMTGGENGRNPDWQNFNVFVPGGVGGWHTGPLQTMNEPLIMFNVLTGGHAFWLAESMEVNDDSTEFTLKLREGIEWADGMPFTAEDVAFTYNLVRDKQDELTNTAEIFLMDRAEVIDPLTVKFILKESSPSWWVTTLTSNHGVTEQILPKHIWEDKDPLTFTFYDPDKGWPFATGPYTMTSASAEQKVFVLREDYWGAKTGFKPLPLVQKVIYIANRDETARAQMMIKNEVDSMSMVPVDTLLDMFKENSKLVTWSKQDPPYGYLDWCPIGLFVNNSADTPVAKSKDIRWALNYSLDRNRLVELAERGAGVTALHMITPYAWFDPFEEKLKPMYAARSLDANPHPDKVIQLMEGQGYAKDDDGYWMKNDERIVMNIGFPSWLARYGVHLVRSLADAGFDASMDQSPGAGAKFGRGEDDYSFGCKGPSGVLGMDPYYMLSLYSSATYRDIGEPPINPWATARWQNAEFDAIVGQMSTLAPTDPKTAELFTDAMEVWFDELPDIYISQLIIRHLGNEEYWTGWSSKDDNYGFLHPLQQEFLKTMFNLKPTK